MCDFCDNFDFGSAKCMVDRYGVCIVMAGGWNRFPKEQQFRFCPQCGAKIGEANTRERLRRETEALIASATMEANK